MDHFYVQMESGPGQSLVASRERTMRRMYLLIGICVVFILAEVAGGLLSHSLAIISDSIHMATDLVSFVITIVSIRLSLRKAD
jgi:Co/Zn/Cd efflux system component